MVTTWSSRGWACNTLNFWATTFHWKQLHVTWWHATCLQVMMIWLDLSTVTLTDWSRFAVNCYLIYKCRPIASTSVSLHRWAQLACNTSLCNKWCSSNVCQLVVFWLYSIIKARRPSTYVILQLCKLPSCSNYVTVCGGISVFLFHIYEVLTGLCKPLWIYV